MDLGIAGRKAAVAAASRGLGFAAAAALAREGVEVAICGRTRDTVDDAARRIGPNAHPLVFDVGTPDAAAAFVHAAQEVLGGIDILVTNAGGPKPGTVATTTVADYPTALALNLLSVVAMCEAAVPVMQAQRFGRIVAITSIAVRQPIPTLVLSNTARAGATGFLKTLAREVAGDGITVNSLQPGLHATDRMKELYGDAIGDQAASVPAHALGRPDDFGATVAFLCSEHARFITGAAIPVDGGAYAGLL
jgi:3-oxoacyl-[acyl-carrier protein] reductase